MTTTTPTDELTTDELAAEVAAGAQLHSRTGALAAGGRVTLCASESEQLAVVAKRHDGIIRMDLEQSLVHNGGDSGTMADWTPIT